MIHARPARRRLVAAVPAVLAVTAGILVAPTATAATTQTPAATTGSQESAVRIPPGSSLSGVGATGFLTATKDASNTYHYRWTRFDDGSVTELPGKARGTGSDSVLLEQEGVFALHDMTGEVGPVTFDRTKLPSSYQLQGAIGSTLVMTAPNASGGTDVHLVAKPNGGLVDRTVTGLPTNASILRVDVDVPQDTALLVYSTRSGGEDTNHLALVDLATGSVVETRDALAFATLPDAAASSTHLAWSEYTWLNGATLAVAHRGTGQTERIVVGGAARLSPDLLGDWLLYGIGGGAQATAPDPLYSLTARSLRTGASVKLLDHHSTTLSAPDGTLLAFGGTVEHGEGLYRISLSKDGTPFATPVASTGEPTRLTLLSQNLPAGVVDLDRNGGVLSLEASFDRHNVGSEIELVHTASQRRLTVNATPFDSYASGPVTIKFSWHSELTNRTPRLSKPFAAYNGDYTWRLKARPLNGIGPGVETSGTFTVVRRAAPHDYNDNGSPDVLLRDSSGRLWRSDSYYDARGSYTTLVEGEQALVGSGWNMFNQIEAAGNIAGSPAGDLVARDTTGVLYHYLGKGDGTFASRVKIGPGWQIYNKIAAGSDLNGDGRPDLLATDTSGALYLYKGTGSATAPYAARVKVGTGWGIYNQLTAVGNIAGGTSGDLVARDKDGVLWLYLGRGDGTFATRTKIGSGWNAYTHLVGIGDANRDGRNDLFASTPGTSSGIGTGYLFKGTGSWSAPFQGRERTQMNSAVTGSPTVA
ncbi:FG-GAP-like repeat-containing protein [Streptomyces sp. NPDC056463]|uniref:FG-GAP-like repeat-containing protein n=1 Tax=Streptomyces sp. NPDC056463 TaxID=3345827 RepID=UPI0036C0EA6F